jgi:hypothetical protein
MKGDYGNGIRRGKTEDSRRAHQKAEEPSPSSTSTILAKIIEMKPRDAKKIINKMVEENALEYWSSGSTSMYGMPGTGKQAHSEGED